MDAYLRNIYYNPKNPGAFAGPQKLHKIVEREGIHNISLYRIRRWLQDQEAYSLQRNVRYKHKRNRIVARGRDTMWDIDLADVSNIQKYNDGIQFWLVAIDVFSRYLWIRPLLDKKHDNVVNALKDIFKQGRIPQSIRSDRGSEFVNRWVESLMKDRNIYYYTTQNQTKANYAERVIQTVKNMMYRYFTYKQSYRYIDVLSDLTANYNHRSHTSLDYRTPTSIGVKGIQIVEDHVCRQSQSQTKNEEE